MSDYCLSPYLRFYIYGIHGYFIEVMFTAAWEFVAHTNWKFPGCTSVWSFFVYAGCSFIIEHIFLYLENRINIVFRGFLYLLFGYTWEFSTGVILRYFNACPWDYSEFKYNLYGLITLEYAPLWYLATLVQEQFLTKNILKLHWKDNLNSKSQTNHLYSKCDVKGATERIHSGQFLVYDVKKKL